MDVDGNTIVTQREQRRLAMAAIGLPADALIVT